MKQVSQALLSVALLAGSAHGQTAPYAEPTRPQVHFSPERNWTNDPNGLVFYAGEYHLFYQYNPFGDQWGHMSWGHAVSTDLLHWKELPVAIPEGSGDMIYTGSVVVDQGNTSGLCGAQAECLVAVYTANSNPGGQQHETQDLAYSTDRGRTWSKYAGNPVLDLKLADFRDPSVFRDEAHHRWLMSVALPKEHKVLFYTSSDLKHWSKASEFGPSGDVEGDWECPDLLQVPARDGKGSVWALKVGLNPGAPQGGSGEQYFLGDFDGSTFKPDAAHTHGWTNYGKDDYCAISYNNLPRAQRPVLMGWMNNWQYASKLPTSPWRGQMSLPRRLSYLHDAAGFALVQEPVVEPLRDKHLALPELLSGGPVATPFELALQFPEGASGVFGIDLYSDAEHWTEIGFDTARREFYIDRSRSGPTIAPEFPVKTVAPLVGGRPFDVRVVVDSISVEAYAQGGSLAMTDLIFPGSGELRIKSFARGGSLIVPTGEAWTLNSIWPKAQQQTQATRKQAHP